MTAKSTRQQKPSSKKRSLAVKKESLKDLEATGRRVKGGTLLYQAPTKYCYAGSGGASASYPVSVSYSR